jgi:hypothetical protein
MSVDWKLFPHQEEGVSRMMKTYREGIKGFFDTSIMGSGKTLTFLSFFLTLCRFLLPGFCSLLIICPKAVVAHWKSEFEKVNEMGFPCFVYHGSARKKAIPLMQKRSLIGSFVTITTIDTLRADFKARNFSLLKSQWFHLICVDEGHNFANYNDHGTESKKHQPNPKKSEPVFTPPLYSRVFALLQRHFTVILTGTPIKNNWHELENLCGLAQLEFPPGHDDVKQKAAYFQSVSYRAPVDLVQKNLPTVSHTQVKLDYDTEEISSKAVHLLANYSQASAKVQPYLKRGQRPPAHLLSQLHTATIRARLFDLVGKTSAAQVEELRQDFIQGPSESKVNKKFRYCADFIEKNRSKKVVIASEFVCVLHFLRDYLRFRHIEVCYYDGTCTDKTKEKSLQSFRAGEVNVLLLSKKCGGVGLNLFGHAMILFEPFLNHYLDDQVVARIVRLGQHHQVEVIHLLFLLMDMTMWKKKMEKVVPGSIIHPDTESALRVIYECSEHKISLLQAKVLALVTDKSTSSSESASSPSSLKSTTRKPVAPKKKPSSRSGKTSSIPVSPLPTGTTSLASSTRIDTKLPVRQGKTITALPITARPPLQTISPHSERIRKSILGKRKEVIMIEDDDIAMSKSSRTKVQVGKQMALWWCQNENCSHKLNVKASVKCKNCGIMKGCQVELIPKKIKRN